MRDTWEKQQRNPDYFYDTPVPPILETPQGRQRAETLEGSIGDLAPKGLQA